MTAALDHAAKPGRTRISKTPPPPAQFHEDELDILALFRLIRRSIVFIVVVAFLLIAIQVPFILQNERTYTSQSRLLIQRAIVTNLAVPGPESYGPLDLSTEVERLLSHPIAERIISDFHLADLEEFNPPAEDAGILGQLIQSIRSRISGVSSQAAPQTDPENVVMSNFLDAIWVQRSGQSSVIEIAFTSRDPQLAADIPNAMIQAYLDAREDQMKAQLDAARDWLADRIDDQRRRVSEMEAQANAFRTADGANSENFQAESVYRITSLSERQTAIIRERTTLEASLAAMEAATTLPEKSGLIDSERISQLERELQTEKRELAKMLQTYGESFGFVVSKREAIAETEDAIGAEVERHEQSLRTRIAALRSEEKDVEAGIAVARDDLARMTVAASEYEAMQDKVEHERAALTALEEQHRTLQNEATMPVQQVEILSPATVSRWPDGRSKSFYLVAGSIAAFLAAITLAIVRDLLDQSIRSQQQVRGIHGARPVGLIPLMRRRVGRRLPDRILEQRDGTFRDSIRGVTLLLERDGPTSLPASILVTSALPGEGKSVVATALALQLVAMGGKVLLVDTDLRHGSVHSNFRTREEPGLANYLSGQVGLETVIRRDEKTGIDFISRGRHGSIVDMDMNRIAAILGYAWERNMTAILDSAPVLATSETARLAAIMDRTLMIVRWGHTNRRSVELAVDRLRACSQEDVLIAINQVNPRRQALYGFKDSGLFAAELRKYHVG